MLKSFDQILDEAQCTHFKQDTLLLSTNRSSLYSLLSSFLPYAFCKNKQTQITFIVNTLQGQSAVSDPLKTPPEVVSPEKIKLTRSIQIAKFTI